MKKYILIMIMIVEIIMMQKQNIGSVSKVVFWLEKPLSWWNTFSKPRVGPSSSD